MHKQQLNSFLKFPSGEILNNKNFEFCYSFFLLHFIVCKLRVGISKILNHSHFSTMYFQDLPLYDKAKILILGGGDGGLLKNLLELKNNTRPEEIIMVELDELVLKACSKHLRSVCGPYLDLDRRVGENYTVLTEDALKFMELKIGNKHALKKYDKFSLNTSCPWEIHRYTPVLQFHEIYGTKIMKKLNSFIARIS